MATKLDPVMVALDAMWKAAPALDSVTVYDGPQANSDPVTEALFVGYDGDKISETVEGATARQEPAAGSRMRLEEGEITCAAVVVSGNVDIPAARTRALDILSDCEDVLRADYLIGGLVMQAGISETRVIPTITQAGCKVRVVFVVAYQAHL